MVSHVGLCDPMVYTFRGILQARKLEWVAFPISRGSSQPRDGTKVSHIAGGFLPTEPQGKPIRCSYCPTVFSSVLFSSVAQLCLTFCDPMNRSTPGLPVHHQLPEFTQTHLHRVRDAIQPSYPLSSPSPPAPNPSQHQSFPMSQLFI